MMNKRDGFQQENIEEVLTRQLPLYFRPIREFQEIIKAHGGALEQLKNDALRMWDNFYLSSCDGATLAYYETLLEIVYHAEDSLDFRRARILQKFSSVAPFSFLFLRNQLTRLYGENGYVLDFDTETLDLKVKVTSDRYKAIDLLYDLLLDVVPAHIKILANQQTTSGVSGRLYASGIVSTTLIQVIREQNRTDIPCGMSIAAGIVSYTWIKTI